MEAFEQLMQLVERRYGIRVPSTQRDNMLRRLSTSAEALGYADLEELYQRVARNERRGVDTLLRQLTVNHTAFYREPGTYELFMTQVLPTLTGRAKPNDPEGPGAAAGVGSRDASDPIRIWSAAASSGEELYTLAFLLAERFGVDALSGRWQLLGTDVDSRVIQQAERGLYPAQRAQALAPQIVSRYLDPVGPDVRVQARIRDLCIFRRLNLVKQPYPFKRKFDAIFCRNVLYYFAEPTQQRVLNGLYDVSRPGGWLLTSVSESLGHLSTRWSSMGQGLYRRLD